MSPETSPDNWNQINGKVSCSDHSHRLSVPGAALYLYNSLATQMNLTRFEYRLLRFFNDACIPLFSFNINKDADRTWRKLLPREFASLDMVRQSVFAFACLNLWKYSNVDSVLDQDKIEWTDMETQLDGSYSHVFETLAVFDNGKDNIFSQTACYFSKTVQQSTNLEIALELFFFSSSLIFAFLGVHPHLIMPVVDFDGDPPLDILSFSGSIRKLIDDESRHFSGILSLLIENMTMHIWGTPIYPSAMVGQLRVELHDYYFSKSGFTEINSRTSNENEILEELLTVMENSFSFAIYKGYPIPIFRMLYSAPLELGELVRARHPFALRAIFVYCCMCIFGGFYFLRTSNMWMDYIRYHIKHFGPLGGVETSIYNYVQDKGRVDFYNFTASMQEFDSTVAHMAQHGGLSLNPRLCFE